jgi:hypothetical protein
MAVHLEVESALIMLLRELANDLLIACDKEVTQLARIEPLQRVATPTAPPA